MNFYAIGNIENSYYKISKSQDSWNQRVRDLLMKQKSYNDYRLPHFDEGLL
jgi:hypothetical protein